jgi:hypothetical protein
MSLRRGIDAWDPSAERPPLRPVFIAGSDAHGSFNHSVGWGWDYESQLMVDDNALGRVRTAVHLPDHVTDTVPETGDILAALEKGACAVTDGPLLEFSLQYDGRTATMGDLLPVSGGGAPVLKVKAHTTAEFGAVEKVDLVTYFRDPDSQAPPATRRRGGILGQIGAVIDGWSGRGPRKTTVRAGQSKIVSLPGSQGYCRLQARTVGQDGEQFCCFTNPVWVRIGDGQKVQLRVELGS